MQHHNLVERGWKGSFEDTGFFFYSVTGAKRVMYRSGEGKGGVDNVMGERAHVKNGCRGQEKREGKTLVPLNCVQNLEADPPAGRRRIYNLWLC